MNKILSKPMRISDELITSAKEATSFKKDCRKIIYKTQKLTAMFKQMLSQEDSKFYDRPIYRVIESNHEVLENALSLVLKCSAKGLKKHPLNLHADYGIALMRLEGLIEDVDWLLGVCFSSSLERDGVSTDEYLSSSKMAITEPTLSSIWKQIAVLYFGSLDDRAEAAAMLLWLAKEDDRYGKLIIEEGGAEPLLKLVIEGKSECQENAADQSLKDFIRRDWRLKCQENAAEAIGYLGHDQESVEHLIRTGVCNVFAKILREGPMKVQAVVAWAVSRLVGNYPKCQDTFSEHNIVGLLIQHLSFEIVQERIQNEFVANKATTVEELEDNQQNISLSAADSETKDYMKAMAAKALCDLVRGNSEICRHITESRALDCFAFLLEKGARDVRYYSATALMEITALAKQESDLRRSTFRSNSPARKIVVDQLVRVIRAEEDSAILIPCIKAIGNLARTFQATESRTIATLVRLLHGRACEISGEAAVALSKFSCTENYLHLYHSKAIIEAGGAKLLVQNVYFSDRLVQLPALLLLCYISLHVPNSEKLAQADVPTVLEWASKQTFVIRDEMFDSLLPKAKSMVSKTTMPSYAAR